MYACRILQKRDIVTPGGCIVKTHDILRLPFKRPHTADQLPCVDSAEKECLYKHWNSKFSTDRRNLGVTRSPSCDLTSPNPPAHPPRPPSRQNVAPSRQHHARPGSRTSSSQHSVRQDFRPASQQSFRGASKQNCRPGSGFARSAGSRGGEQRTGSASMKKTWVPTPSASEDIHIHGTASPYHEQGYRPDTSLSDFIKTAPKPPTAHKTKPSKVWAYHVPQTTAHLLQKNNNHCTPSSESLYTPTSWKFPKRSYPVPSEEGSRAQSATFVRRKVGDTRQVKSAGRSRAAPCADSSRPQDPEDKDRSDEELKDPLDAEGSSEEDSNSEQDDQAQEDAQDYKGEDEVSSSPPALDYNEQLEKHGWKMEIPGDPLGLKTPCIIKRMPYTRVCDISELRAEPPKCHSENYDTFFYNTIPRKPLSFDIHQEFVSEILHAKRMELQKRDGGVGYRYKNFSFVY